VSDCYINNAGTILFLGVPYLLTIPVIDFTLGANLSPIACMGKELALDYLKSAIRDGHAGIETATLAADDGDP
jgi:hypothetical protein